MTKATVSVSINAPVLAALLNEVQTPTPVLFQNEAFSEVEKHGYRLVLTAHQTAGEVVQVDYHLYVRGAHTPAVNAYVYNRQVECYGYHLSPETAQRMMSRVEGVARTHKLID